MIEDIENRIFDKLLDVKTQEASQDYGLLKYDLNNIKYKVLETRKVKAFLMLHVTKGSGNFQLALENYKIAKNTIYFAYPGQLVSKINLKNVDGYILFASPEFLLKANPKLLDMKLFQLYGNRHEITLPEEISTELLKIALNVSKELNSIEYRRDEILQSLINLHIYKTDRILYHKYFNLEKNIPYKVREFYALLNLKQNPNLKVKDYAWELNISPNYLNEMIKKNTGNSVKSLIKEKAIRQACVYLIHSDFNVKEIAYQLGYNYPQYFYRDFKNAIGITPIQYRLSNR